MIVQLSIKPWLVETFFLEITFLIGVGNNSLYLNSWNLLCQDYRLCTDYCMIVIVILLLHSAKSQDLSYIVKGLGPYRIYTFTLSFCSFMGCVTSASATFKP